MPVETKAAFIGDSHGIIALAAATANGIHFRHSITAASAMFSGASFAPDEAGSPTLLLAPGRLDPALHDAKKISHRLTKASKLTRSYQALFADPVPVYANIGATARTFVQQIMAAQANQTLSRKLARHAAKEFFVSFKAQYAEIRSHCPQVTVFYGPTRFTPDTRDLWLAYDDAIRQELDEIGIEILDLRNELGDSTGLLRPEFYPEPDDDVHGNAAWGLAVVEAIQAHCQEKVCV